MGDLIEKIKSAVQRTLRLLLFPIIIASVISLMLPVPVLADGSGDQYPSGATGKRALVEWRTDSFTTLTRRTFFRVYAISGENILMGSSAIGVSSNADIVVYAENKITSSQISTSSLSAITPDFSCNTYRSTHSGAGVLDTRTKELAGAVSSSNANGYTPCVYTAPATGIYWVAIYGPSGSSSASNGTAGTIAAPDISTNQLSGVSMWNITVRSGNVLSGVNKPGRVFVDYLAEYTGGNGADYQLYSTMYAATNDGYVYKVDTNGLDPQGFIFFGNRVGFYDPDGVTPLYHDVVYSENTLSTPMGGAIIAPATAKIFFTNPLSSDLPVSLLPTPVTPNINNVTFVGTASGVNGYYSQGGVFKYTGNVGGISEIIIQGPGQTDFKADNTKNRRLLSEAVSGSNSITWDGKDNNGDYFPVGTNYAFKVILHAGEYHFPVIDSENSVYGGPSITMLNPVGGVCPFGNCRTGFYDDRVYKVSTGTIVPTGNTVGNTLPGDTNSLNPPTINHSDLSTGYDTSTTQRAYGYATAAQAGSTNNLKLGFGNWKALDLWAFYPVEAVQSTLNVVAQVNSDLGIMKSHSGTFAIGGTGTFTINVSNVGTANISAGLTTITDTLPAGLTLTGVPTGTGWTCTGSAGATTFTCTRSDKLNKGDSFPTITYTVNIGSTSSANVVNTVTLTNPSDTNSGNNTATDTVNITSPELTITKTDNVSQQATVGSLFNWTITVQNQGTVAANFTSGQTILTDTLPTGPTYGTPTISSTTNVSNAANIQCSISSNTLSCVANGATVSFLESGSSLTVAIPVTPSTAASLSNTAVVDPNNVVTESNETNNSSTDVVTVAGSDIAVTKTVSPTTAILESGTVTYTVKATNNGPRDATAVVVTDLLPAGLTLVTSSPSQGTYSSTTGIWTIGALANGVSATLTLTATANTGTGGTTITNTASRTSSSPLDSNTTNDSASVSTSVVSIDAINDTGSSVNGTAGGTSLANVLTNDKLNGSAPDISKVNLTQVSTTNSGVTLDTATGKVNVAAGTASGSYTVTYQICDKSNTTFCDTATVTVPVVVIDATNDSGSSINGAVGGQTLANVLANDTLNGTTALLTNVNLTQVSTTNSGVTLDPATGKVNVAAGTPSGSYTVNYQICDKSNPTFCDSAVVTVPVVVIEAVDDAGSSVNGLVGGQSLANVLVNDTLNGSPVTLSGVNLTQVSTTNSGVILDPTTGKVNVAAGTPAGSYSVTYKICDKSNPTFCDTALVTVPVTAALIDAKDDTSSAINGVSGGTNVVNVLSNDTLNAALIDPTKVTLAQTVADPSGALTLNSDGSVNVAAGTPSGTYHLTYQICEKLNPTNCDTATVTIPVVVIDAKDDAGTTINGVTGGESLANVLTNDTLNGSSVTLSSVNLTQVSTTNSGVTLDPTTGKVNVASGTASGNYSVTYKICDKANPTFCDTAIVTVPVVVIDAIDDSGAVVNGVVGGQSLADVLVNDTLNGVKATLSSVTLSQVSTTNSGVNLDPTTGKVSAAAGTPSGNYVVTYKICDKSNPTICDTAVVNVPVVVIDAVNDNGSSVNGTVGGQSLANVLANDTLNGNPVTLSSVNLTQSSTTNSGVNLDTTTGKVNVAAGTSAGNYTITYQICDKSNSTFCDTASVTVPVVVIDANNDNGTIINGAIGGESLANVLANDTLNGSPASLTTVNLTQESTTNPGVTLDETTGKVNVAAGTLAGNYTVTYKICDKSNPTFCDTATVTVPVVVINAADDSGGSVNGLVGGESLADVLTNDTLNGNPVSLSGVNLTQESTTNAGVTLDPTTGKVNVAAGTPAGSYTVTYKICDKSNPTFCDTAVVTVPVTAAVISASDDTSTTVNGTDGATSLLNVLTNDTLNGSPVDPSKVNLTETIADPSGALTLNPDGSVDVAAGTPAGSYSLTYQICEKLNPTNCDTATVTVPVVVIDAVDDSGASVSGFVGGESLADVLTNDTLNGSPLTLSDVNLTQESTTNSGVTLDPTTGKVNVAAGTPAGSYTVTYKICDKSNPTFCDTAAVTVPVTAPVINAVDDDRTSSPVLSTVGGNPGNAFTNDTLNGLSIDPTLISASIITPASNSGVTLNTTNGDIHVNSGTPSGTYTIVYKICEVLNPANCDTATITVLVVSIDAVNDTGNSVNGLIGGESLANVLTNDSVNGTAAVIANVDLTQVSTTNSGVTLDEATGKVNVAPGTPAGSYTVTYKICDKSNPTYCDTADVTVPVTAATILANDDPSAKVNGTDGATNLINVLTNDTLNGAGVDPTKVNLTETVADPSGALTLNPDGSVDVAAGTPAGSYSLTYQICEKLNPTNCDTATVTVPVVVIDAADDSGASVNGFDGGESLADVLTNDTLNGSPVTLSDVNLTQESTTNAGVTLDTTTGKVNVAAGTPAGSYTVTYKICDKSNPTFCDTAAVTVPVTAALIDATDDLSVTVNGTDGATGLLNVLDNDNLNGSPVDPTKITLTETVADPSGALTLNPDGSVDVAAGTPAGSYSLTYQICEKLNPTNCDTATVTVPVVVIDAADDSGASVNGFVGGESLADVLTNDTLNGSPLTLSDVNLTQESTTNSGVTLDPTTGKVNVAAGTPAGSYTVTYKICDKSNPTFCDTADVIVPVTPAPIDAKNDTSVPVNGTDGGLNLINVLTNDTLNGILVDPAKVTLTETVADPKGALTLNPNGSVDVAAGTSAGTYTLTYQICEKLNPTNCDTATVTVPVVVIDAVNDSGTTVVGSTGGQSLADVLTNDTLNGAPTSLSAVNLSQVSTSDSRVTLDETTGEVNVDPGTPAGSYTVTYKICDKSNPTFCDTADVSIPVIAALIDAKDDNSATVNGSDGATNVINVLTNDTLNGTAVDLTKINLSTTIPDATHSLTLNPDGSLDVAAGTPAGNYTLTYQICEKLNPTNCDTATVTVPVVVIDANNDNGTTINGATGGESLADVLANDTLNGSPASLTTVILTQESTTNPGVTLDETTGKVNVAAGTPAGNYTITYKICDKSNPTFCDTAAVTVPVVVINAVNDSGASVNGLVGGESLADVLTNDTLNGNPVSLSGVNLTQESTTNAGVTLDPTTGKVNVAAGTPAGSYTVTYKICDKSNPTFCDTVVVTVPVTAAVINASDDTSTTVNGTDGATNLLNVLANDTLNGSPVDPSKVNLTETVADPSGALTLNPDGSVDVAAGTPAGSYSLTYQICEKLNTTNCDTATVTVPVVVIDAVNDSGASVNGFVGGESLADVLTNDTLNGSPLTLSDVNLTQESTTNAGVTLDTTTGKVNVAAGTPAGSYTVTYKICDKSNPTFCDTAAVTVPVTAPVINAVDDSSSAVDGIVGNSNVLNVFDNDTLNGSAVVPSNVILTTTLADPSGALTLNANGSVSVAAGTPGGTYSLTYQICEKLNPTNCDTATVTVPVVVIDASDDTGSSVNGKVGGISVTNVLANDTLNGITATLGTVSLEEISSTSSNVSLNIGTAEVVVAPGTASGSYTLTYKICDLLNSEFCDVAQVTVPVNSSTILAVDDDYTSTPIAGKTGGDAGNAIANDTLNGAAVTIADINVSVVTASDDPGVTLDTSTGMVSVAAGTSGGEHAIAYRICEKLNPSNCSDAKIKVLVNTYDLGLSMTLKSGQPSVVTAGDYVTYTITLKNAGNLTSGNPIVITDTIPTGMTLNDSHWTAGSGNSAVYTLTSDLAASGSSSDTISFDLTLKVDSGYAGGALTNFVEITTDQGDDVDSTPANGVQTPAEDDQASVDITAHNYGLGIAKTAAESSYAITGDLIHYTYVVTNGGDVDQNNVVVTDDKIDNDSTNIDCGSTGSNVISVLKPGAANAVTCVATYTVTDSDVTAGMVTNTASVVSDESTTPVTTQLTVPGLFDPMTGIKVFDDSKLPTLTWTMTWINSSNDLPVAGHVSDPIPMDSTIISAGTPSGYAVPSGAPAGSSNLGVSCTTPAGSTTTTTLCYYRGPETGFPNGQIIWEGVIGGDKGHIDTKTSKNQIVISFSTKIPDNLSIAANIAEMDSDLNSDGDYDDPGEKNSATAMSTWTRKSESAASVATLPLPITGFAPGVVTSMLPQPFSLQYQSYVANGLSFDIPVLGLNGLQIVGVPQTADGWNVQWLDKNIGYLDGTAFPTWKGNSVLTGHVYLSNGLPGPFVNLGKLKYGDKILIHAWGQTYTYEVRQTKTIDPSDSSEVLKHEDLPWITLLTCKDYDEKSKTYLNRYMVKAVLISVK
jgi:LPXTG-site transpeptidase (sortase) family protein